MPLPRDYISHNQVRLYNECPRKYYFSYVEETAVPISDKILLGIVFHATIENYFTRRIQLQSVGDADTLEFFHTSFEQTQGEKEIRWRDSVAKTRERGAAFVRFFLREIAPALRPLMVEKELEVEIPEFDVRLKGIIDLIEEDFSITDFKTTTSKWSESSSPPILQMLIYKYLFERTFEARNPALRFEVIYAKSPAAIRRQTLRVEAGPSQIEDMLSVLGHVVANIRQGIFARNENHRCTFCDFREPCRARNDI